MKSPMNDLTTPVEGLAMNLPWRILRGTAVMALITKRTLNEQLEVQLRDGLRIVKSEEAHDQHAENAAKFFSVTASAVTPKQRRFAKNAMFPHNFAPRSADKDTL